MAGGRRFIGHVGICPLLGNIRFRTASISSLTILEYPLNRVPQEPYSIIYIVAHFQELGPSPCDPSAWSVTSHKIPSPRVTRPLGKYPFENPATQSQNPRQVFSFFLFFTQERTQSSEKHKKSSRTTTEETLPPPSVTAPTIYSSTHPPIPLNPTRVLTKPSALHPTVLPRLTSPL